MVSDSGTTGFSDKRVLEPGKELLGEDRKRM